MNELSPGETPRILAADDQHDVLESVRFLLHSEGWKVDTASSPNEALVKIEQSEFDVVLADLNYTRDTTSGQEGLDLLSSIAKIDEHLPVVVMTAWASIEIAVEAMRRGARDFIEKPWDNHRLLSILKTQTELGRALRDRTLLAAENELLRGEEPDLIAGSSAMQPVLELIRKVAPSDANILLTGENGTGKSLLAQILHRHSLRKDKPLITVNIGGLSESVFESELFGHVRGAFTDARNDRVGRFELAQHGTLFMDEIANIPPGLQAKLLRVLESGEFERLGSSRTQHADVRVISATNADLREELARNRFRKDLLFRLNTVEIRIPSLRQRQEDILPLATHFLSQHRGRYRKSVTGFSPSAIDSLRLHEWPGNVRELSHVLERATLMCEGSVIESSDLGFEHTQQRSPGLDELTLEDAEQLLIRKAMARFDGNVSDAAKGLGLSRSALYRRLEKYGL